MASMASAARDIQAISGRDNLTAVAARGGSVTRSHPLPLPTPPNSISPGLLPHGLCAQLRKARLEPAVPYFDLHDADTHSQLGSPPDDSTGVLTPVMLARHHLPEILLNHGPLAIRHIMGYLTSSVPGFAAVAPAKARRLVVGALEGRGSSGEGGGLKGDVVFEKVGWGRWDARRRGQAARHPTAPMGHDPSPPYLSGIPIAGGATWSNERTRIGGGALSSARDSPVFSNDDRAFHMDEDPVDNMSLDGSASASCSEAPDDDDDVLMDDPEDVTDEEDWAAIGAAGLRAASYSQSAGRPGTFPPRFTSSGIIKAPRMNNPSYDTLANNPDAQEREAIEALLSLGSV
ncbi:putative Sin3 binding protein-domain-containing protein [Coniella lustricola]|uniref:Putative Sin3 binding protein-domain-containing protein n=1 Tax=Coniella lustricola TaxID=2025994 RepID=A0A2T3AMY8_9PEZI|nr:putative Sin3 binding protein-domain-containing protein [Coniella lustricola]